MKSICKLMRIGRWSEPRFFFVCQLVEVFREADTNETSGEAGLALLVGESQSWSQISCLSHVELEYHAEWCALNSPSIRVAVIIIKWSREGM